LEGAQKGKVRAKVRRQVASTPQVFLSGVRTMRTFFLL
jgi:hypothetical protein